MTATLHPASTAGTRTLETRRPHFRFPVRVSRRHFVRGDLLSSHVVAVLSTSIPEGERFVVDAVKRYRGDLQDPHLKKQANAFVGQESMHQREHERFNEALRRSGYPMQAIHAIGSVFFGIARRLPRHTQLAMTAAIEHWTAVLAEQVLDRSTDEPAALEEIDEEFRAMIVWHLIEEIEHKSVAFDIMQALGTTEAQRIAAMRLLVQLITPLLAASVLVSLATDPAAWNPLNLRRSLRWIQANSAVGQRGFMDLIREWNDEGFHPDQRDHGELLERWRAEAFGPGSIVEQRSRRPR